MPVGHFLSGRLFQGRTHSRRQIFAAMSTPAALLLPDAARLHRLGEWLADEHEPEFSAAHRAADALDGERLGPEDDALRQERDRPRHP